MVFAEKWKFASSEKQDAESFWRDFFRNLSGVEDENILSKLFNLYLQESEATLI